MTTCTPKLKSAAVATTFLESMSQAQRLDSSQTPVLTASLPGHLGTRRAPSIEAPDGPGIDARELALDAFQALRSFAAGSHLPIHEARLLKQVVAHQASLASTGDAGDPAEPSAMPHDLGAFLDRLEALFTASRAAQQQKDFDRTLHLLLALGASLAQWHLAIDQAAQSNAEVVTVPELPRMR